MIVTSLTIYNPRETKADNTDYSTLEFTKVTEPMDSTYAYCITENTLTDFGRLNFYGTYFMQVIGSGNSKMKEATVTIDGKVQTDTTIAFDRADAITGFNVSNLSNNAYHELKIEGDGGNITIILKKGSVNGETEESTELKAPAAPDGLVANINDVKTNYTIAFANVATATSYKFYLGEKFVKEITNGGVVTIAELQLVEGQTYTFGVSAVNAAGESAISTVEVTVPSKSEETTEPTEPTEPFDPSTITDWTPVGSSTIMSYYIANDASKKVTVNSDITVTSINLNVAMQKGASVRLATPTGLRFQTVITSGNDIAVSDILNKDFVTTGTLITTFDLFSANGNKLDKDSQYTKLDIANSGWYGDEVGKFCGSIIKINKDNYEKKFVGVGYATITYNNGKTLSIYANVNEADNARSIYYVANAVKDAGYKNCNAAQIAIIDKYIAKEEL